MSTTLRYVKQLRKGLESAGLIGSMYKILSRSQSLAEFHYETVKVGDNELCRGVQHDDFMVALKENSLLPPQPKKKPHEVFQCDIGKHVLYGDPNLLSFTRDPHTAKYYGANRKYYPASGFIIVGALGAYMDSTVL